MKYDFQAKQQYRERVWREIGRRCGVPTSRRRAVYLDTREGLETLWLLEAGYSAKNLTAVNREPVEVALLTQKLKKLGIDEVATAGIEWERAVSERLQRADVVNFDGMGCLHQDLVDTVRLTIRILKPCVIAVNMLGGREAGKQREILRTLREMRDDRADGLPTLTTYGKRVNKNHAERVRALWKAAQDIEGLSTCSVHVVSMAWDVYASTSGQPMVWSVVQLAECSDDKRAWRAVEKEWCIAPNCAYLGNPESYRSKRAAYQECVDALRPWHGMTFKEVLDATDEALANDIFALMTVAEQLAGEINAMDLALFGTSDKHKDEHPYLWRR